MERAFKMEKEEIEIPKEIMRETAESQKIFVLNFNHNLEEYLRKVAHIYLTMYECAPHYYHAKHFPGEFLKALRSYQEKREESTKKRQKKKRGISLESEESDEEEKFMENLEQQIKELLKTQK